MIRVTPAPEPPHFDQQVRMPGLGAIAELVGERPAKRRPGRRRNKIADRREDIPAKEFPPFWREALPDLAAAYRRICAYSCLYIEPVTGSATVDHMAAVSLRWDRVYEWDNYRLACGRMNSRKGNIESILDPFQVEDDWFALELVGYQVVPGPGTTGEVLGRVEATIRLLGLNDEVCRETRAEYAERYLNGDIRLEYLERRAPFVARELRRQGKLRLPLSTV
jgi:5-methylcytosine-specific restriction endonuclease McrA